MEGAMFQTLQCVLVEKQHLSDLLTLDSSSPFVLVDHISPVKKIVKLIRSTHVGFFFLPFALVDHISPGGPLVVLKEAVDYAEEEGKAWKTATE